MRAATWAGLSVPVVFLSLVPSARAAGADDPLPIAKKELLRSTNNLKQIALAMITSADANNGTMPTDILDKNGKPLLSWRVAILPFIEEQPLYNQFKLDEAWDSSNNKKLISKMPNLYAPIRVKAKAGETFYQVFTGEKALFGPKKTPKFPGSIPDGTSNTGLVFEAGEPVIWSKPADLLLEDKKALPKLGGLFDGECHVAMCDGSVRRLKKNLDEKELRKLIMPADGEAIDFSKLDK